MEPIFVSVPVKFWPFPAKRSVAITLFPCIFMRADYRHYEPIVQHEQYHWRQALRWGVWPWYLTYLVLLPFYGGGFKHPLEKPAYELQWQLENEAKSTEA